MALNNKCVYIVFYDINSVDKTIVFVSAYVWKKLLLEICLSGSLSFTSASSDHIF